MWLELIQLVKGLFRTKPEVLQRQGDPASHGLPSAGPSPPQVASLLALQM